MVGAKAVVSIKESEVYKAHRRFEKIREPKWKMRCYGPPPIAVFGRNATC